MKAIVYTSNTGFTKEYALLLAEKTGVPALTLKEAKGTLNKGDEIVYLGWLMAGFVKGYSTAKKLYNIKAVGGVCMGETGSQLDTVRKNNAIADDVAVYTMQGGFDMSKLSGIYKFMMKFMVKHLIKEINLKEKITDSDRLLLKMMTEGASAVSEENLSGLIELLCYK